MGEFAYNFCLMLLHSLWQSASLLLLYKAHLHFNKNLPPASRKNWLLLALLVQVILSAVTLFVNAKGAKSLQPSFLLSTFYTETSVIKNAVPFVFTLYSIIVFYKSSVLFYHWKRFKCDCSNSLRKASSYYMLFTFNKAVELGIRKKVRLWYSDVVTSPVTFGFLKPVILLPVALLNQLTVKEAEMLILHELTHIKNNDYLLNFILIVSETIFFFNPFIKTLCELVKFEREKNCDVQVIRSVYPSLIYAEALLKIARFKSGTNEFQMAAASNRHQLLNRITFFTSDKNLNFKSNNYAPITYFFFILLFFLNYVTVRECKQAPATNTYAYTASAIPVYNPFSLTASLNPPAPIVRNDNNNKTGVPQQNQKRGKPKNVSGNFARSKKVSEPNNVEFSESGGGLFIPVGNVAPDEVKEFIFNEENSAGNKITRAYKMILVNGKWTVHPLWMYTETRLRADSLVAKDSLVRPFNIIQ